jgi:hypothetical protein
VTGAQISWFGIYTLAKSSEMKTGQGPTVKEGEIIPPTTSNDQIVLYAGIRFGFGYTLTGSPANGRADVTASFKFPPPGVLNPVVGRRVDGILIFPDCELGGKGCLVGFAVDDPNSLPTGVWTFQVYNSTGRVLAEKQFAVSLP